MPTAWEIAKRNTKQRNAFINWATGTRRLSKDEGYDLTHGFLGFVDFGDYQGEGIYRGLSVHDGQWYFQSKNQGKYDLGLSTQKFRTAEDVFNYVGGGTGEQAKKYAGEQSQKTKQAKDKTATNLLNQRIDNLSNVISGNQEEYNLRIESAFNKLSDILQSMQASSQSPSVIQTLYLDRQAKTFLPSSIRDRGLAGALSTGQGNVG